MGLKPTAFRFNFLSTPEKLLVKSWIRERGDGFRFPNGMFMSMSDDFFKVDAVVKPNVTPNFSQYQSLA
ncbi:MAG: hypothetical protein F6K46_13825 [Moorea sp. SIO3E8]|nr:hypothetical protein [Moorena sp. SIO3E8]